MMLRASLVLGQRSPVGMVAHKGVVVAATALNRVGDARAADDKTPVKHAREMCEAAEGRGECGLVRLGDVGAEFEEDCASAGISKTSAYLCGRGAS